MTVSAKQLEQPNSKSWTEALLGQLYVQGVPVIPDFRGWIDAEVNAHFNGPLGRWRSTHKFTGRLQDEADKKRSFILTGPGPFDCHLEDLNEVLAERMRTEIRWELPQHLDETQMQEALTDGFEYVGKRLNLEHRTYFHLECITGTAREVIAQVMGVTKANVNSYAHDTWHEMEDQGIDRVAMGWFVERLGGYVPRTYNKGDKKQTKRSGGHMSSVPTSSSTRRTKVNRNKR
ncbi:hypothetical protein ACWGIA_39300 [Streptomyces bobili]